MQVKRLHSIHRPHRLAIFSSKRVQNIRLIHKVVVWHCFYIFQFSYIISTFMLLIIMFEMRESLPIESTDVKLIVDGQPSDVTEHEGEFNEKKKQI